MRNFRVSAVLFALLVSACDDEPAGPCEAAGCVEGVDLAIVEAAVDWSADQDVDARVGGRLVEPGDELVMRYRVMNRGSVASDPAVLFVGTYHNEGNLSVIATMPFGDWIDVPALEPGESVAATVERGAPNTLWLTTDSATAVFELFAEGGARYYDARPENAHVAITYHIELPVARVDAAGSEEPLVAGEARMFDVTVSNESATTAIAAGTELKTCVFVATRDGDCAQIGTFAALPSVAPGNEVTVSVPITVTSTDLEMLEGQDLIGVGVCADRRCDRVELTIVSPDTE